MIDPAVGLNLSSLRRAPSLSLSDGTSLSLHAVSAPQQSTDQKALYYVLQASTDDQAASLAGETLTLDLFALGKTPYNKTAVFVSGGALRRGGQFCQRDHFRIQRGGGAEPDLCQGQFGL